MLQAKAAIGLLKKLKFHFGVGIYGSGSAVYWEAVLLAASAESVSSTYSAWPHTVKIIKFIKFYDHHFHFILVDKLQMTKTRVNVQDHTTVHISCIQLMFQSIQSLVLNIHLHLADHNWVELGVMFVKFHRCKGLFQAFIWRPFCTLTWCWYRQYLHYLSWIMTKYCSIIPMSKKPWLSRMVSINTQTWPCRIKQWFVSIRLSCKERETGAKVSALECAIALQE